MVFGLLPELEVAVITVLTQLPTLHSHQDCAARLPSMGAVREPTVQRTRLDLRERLIHSITRSKKAQFAHSGRVDQHSPTVKNEQMAALCRMDTFSSSTDSLCIERISSDYPVDK